MRKALLAVAVLAALLGGVAGTASPAAAVGVVDLSTSVSSNPATVSPAGALVRYTIGYANTPDSLLASGAKGSVTTTGGGTFVGLDGDTAGCSVNSSIDPSVTCTFDLAPGASKTINLVLQTPSTAGTVSATSTIDTDPNLLGVIPDTNTTNNSATVATPVTGNATGSSAFLRNGDSLQYRNHVMTVIATYGAANGVIASMADAVVVPGTPCGTRACSSEGLHYDFDQRPEYQGRVAIAVDYDGDDPCYGYGAPTCSSLYYRLQVTDTPAPVQSCTIVAPDSKAPCMRSITKSGPGFVYHVEANTNDPDLIPPSLITLNR